MYSTEFGLNITVKRKNQCDKQKRKYRIWTSYSFFLASGLIDNHAYINQQLRFWNLSVRSIHLFMHRSTFICIYLFISLCFLSPIASNPITSLNSSITFLHFSKLLHHSIPSNSLIALLFLNNRHLIYFDLFILDSLVPFSKLNLTTVLNYFLSR